MKADFARHIAWTSDHPLGLEIERAEGPFLVLTDGRKLIDFISGIAVSSLGHRHPSVLRAIRDQLDRHLHVMVYGEFIQAPQVRLAKQLASVLPAALDSVYFTMSGTEANEGALKLAKKYTERGQMVAFERSFHGDTHGSLSVTGRRIYQDPFRPLLPDVTFLPFGDFEALEGINDSVACVIVEPIQGEGGMRLPPPGWFRALRARCTAMGALLILDEIQTGFGRTGRMFAFEHEGIVPDILTLAKAMGGGMPLGAFIANAKVMQSLRRDPPLSHVTTFGGHPVSCAAAYATLQVLRDEGLVERALWVGERVRTKLRHALVTDLRGRGAMLGMNLMNTRVAKQVVDKCLQRRVLLGWTLHSGTVIRIAPPLNIPEDTLNEALEIITEVLDVVQAMDA
ncbi:MAG: aspartate aminotransferase family protein [Bacteroidetes bacterium]|nr:aspartate aminotransferase family protein [Bacteroidota bacterium]